MSPSHPGRVGIGMITPSSNTVLEPIRQGVRERFGAVHRDITTGLSIRHDHGSRYMSHDFQTEIR